jgi:hypothetical protein
MGSSLPISLDNSGRLLSVYKHYTFIAFFNKKGETSKPSDEWETVYDDLVTDSAYVITPKWDMHGAKSIFCSDSIALVVPDGMSIVDLSKYVAEVASKASATITSNE